MSKDFYYIDKEHLGEGAKIKLIKLKESGEVFYEIALDMLNTIKKNNNDNKHTVFILPVGPIGQYSIFTRLVNEQQVSLKNCYFINMDEYLTDDKKWIDKSDRLSFRGFMQKNLYDKIDEHLLNDLSQRIFPDPDNLGYIDEIINKLGGVDVCYGGIGINGHVAFNEADYSLTKDEFKNLKTRVLRISDETKVANSIGDLSGAMELMPKYCVTIGMKNIFESKKIVLACFRNWHRAVIRRACYGEVSASFPVSILQEHSNCRLLVNENAQENI